MPMLKKGAAPVAEKPKEETTTAAKAESGTPAAVSRLTTKKEEPAGKVSTGYKGRDYADEARGKTRCAQFEAALMSPAIAGMKFSTMDEYLKLVVQAANAGVAYTFGENK